MRLTREQGVSLTGPDGPLMQLTKTVIETALNEEQPAWSPGGGTGGPRL